LNYAHKNQNNFNAIFVSAQLNERIPHFWWYLVSQVESISLSHGLGQGAFVMDLDQKLKKFRIF